MITRTQAAAYLNGSFNAFAVEAGQTTFDAASTGYGPDIDNALRALAVAEADLATAEVADGDRAKYFALLDYMAARRLWRRLSSRASMSLGPASIQYKGVSDNLKLILDDAADALVPLGLAPSAWSAGILSLDWLDNDEETL